MSEYLQYFCYLFFVDSKGITYYTRLLVWIVIILCLN